MHVRTEINDKKKTSNATMHIGESTERTAGYIKISGPMSFVYTTLYRVDAFPLGFFVVEIFNTEQDYGCNRIMVSKN